MPYNSMNTIERGSKGGYYVGYLQRDTPFAVGWGDQPTGSGKTAWDLQEYCQEVLGRRDSSMGSEVV